MENIDFSQYPNLLCSFFFVIVREIMSRPIASGKKYRFNKLKVLISLTQSLLLNQSVTSDWLCLVYLVSSTWCALVRQRKC